MNINARGKILPVTAVSALAFSVAACGGGSSDLSGSGASFPNTFYQTVISEFNDNADFNVDYNSTGSGTGKQEFAEGLTDLAGTDSLVDPDEMSADDFFYIPTVAAPITVSYNLPDVDELQLSPDTLALLFQGEITSWDAAEIAEENPDADLPDTEVTVAHRSDGSGTTSNFTAYLEKTSELWELGAGDTVNWPSGAQGAPQNTGVAEVVERAEGAIGYIDLADAEATDQQMAAILNQDGEYVLPTLEGTTAGLDGAEIADDLSYDPLDAAGADSYPITAPTYLLVRAEYDDAETADSVKEFLEYMLGEGQDLAEENYYAPLPDSMREAALDQLDQVEPTS